MIDGLKFVATVNLPPGMVALIRGVNVVCIIRRIGEPIEDAEFDVIVLNSVDAREMQSCFEGVL